MSVPLEFTGAGGQRIVDLSMPVHADMMTFPRVPPPMLLVNETHEEFAERIGIKAHGLDMGTAHYVVIQDDHVGTHCDARKHIVPDAGGPETIPLDYCFADGVLLDFTALGPGTGSRRRRSRPSWTASATRSSRATSSSSTRARARTTARSATRPTTRV
jgi:kynurenine formamidase